MISRGAKYRWHFVIVLLLALFVAGCTSLGTDDKTARADSGQQAISGEGLPSEDQAVDQKYGSVDASNKVGTSETVTTEQSGVVGYAGEKVSVVLYFASSDGKLVAVRREMPKTQGIARQTMIELCQGPEKSDNLLATIPPGVTLKDINIKDGLARVDFSRELKTRHWGGSSGEILTVYSIVNTLTQFHSIEKVEILVEGQRLDTLAGHLDLSKPLERDGSLIKSLK